MSYTIEYARQFIKSGEGITPCWLAGDNNVTEGRGRYERRAREWSCFCNFVGASETEIMAKAQSWLGGYQEHWKRHGKWVNDKGLISWVKSGIRSAASVENILKRNPVCCGDIHCSVHVWRGFNFTVELDYYVHTTAEFDEWIRRYRALKDELSKEKASMYPKVDFGTEVIHAPIAASIDELFCFRQGNRYLTKLAEHVPNWSRDPSLALTFSYEEAMDFLNRNHFLLSNASLARVPKEHLSKAIIRITAGRGAGSYVYQASPWWIRMSGKDSAYQYSSHKTAQLALKKILKKYPMIKNAEVVPI